MNSINPKYKRAERRRRSAITKDLRSPKYKKRVIPDKKKDVTKMSHLDFVEAIQELDEERQTREEKESGNW